MGCSPILGDAADRAGRSGVDARIRKARVASGADVSPPAINAGRGVGARSWNHARLHRSRRPSRAVRVGRAYTPGVDRGGLACVVHSGLVRRSDSAVGQLSELARPSARACKGLHLRAHYNLAHRSGVDLPLDRGSRKGDSACAGFSAVGRPAAVAKTAAHDVELAVVDRRDHCGAGGRTAAQLFLQRRSPWHRDTPGVGREPEAGRSVSTCDGELGSAAGVGRGAAYS